MKVDGSMSDEGNGVREGGGTAVGCRGPGIGGSEHWDAGKRQEKANGHVHRGGGAWEVTVKGKAHPGAQPRYMYWVGRLEKKDWVSLGGLGQGQSISSLRAEAFDVLAHCSLHFCIPDRISIR